MEFIITRRGGVPCRETLPARLCTPADIPALWALEQQVLAALPDPSLFIPTPPDELADQLHAGFILAVWDGEEAAAYVSVEYCGQDARSYGRDVGAPDSELDTCANLDTVLVRPDLRGNGLQQALLTAAEQFLAPCIRALGATVSPDNLYSRRNFEACGWQVVCQKEKYGGVQRLVLKKIVG